MVVTGAGAGIMGASQEGAGAERSFGLNIRLPFEQEANPWIASDPKLISFKYFFTRKLFLVREAHAMAFLPGGFGTADEAFEALTLIQTGKSPVLPLVMLDEPGGTYWKTFDTFVRREMVGRGMVGASDPDLYRLTDDVETAAAEIEAFYRNYHSQRYVRDSLVLRMRRALSAETLDELNARFTDIMTGPAVQAPGPVHHHTVFVLLLRRQRLAAMRRNGHQRRRAIGHRQPTARQRNLHKGTREIARRMPQALLRRGDADGRRIVIRSEVHAHAAASRRVNEFRQPQQHLRRLHHQFDVDARKWLQRFHQRAHLLLHGDFGQRNREIRRQFAARALKQSTHETFQRAQAPGL